MKKARTEFSEKFPNGKFALPKKEKPASPEAKVKSALSRATEAAPQIGETLNWANVLARSPEAKIPGTTLIPTETKNAPRVARVYSASSRIGYMFRVKYFDKSSGKHHFFVFMAGHFTGFSNLRAEFPSGKTLDLEEKHILVPDPDKIAWDIALWHPFENGATKYLPEWDSLRAYTLDELPWDKSLVIYVERPTSTGETAWFASPSKHPLMKENKWDGVEYDHFASTLPGDCGLPLFEPNGCVVGLHVAAHGANGSNGFILFSGPVMGWAVGAICV